MKTLDNVKLKMIPQTQLSIIHKKKNNRFYENLTKCFKEFSKNTSIHGFKYLGQTRGCNIEKIWWLTILCFCIYMCTVLTIMTLKKREENPVFVSFRQKPMHTWDFPFPAITICPAFRIKTTKYNLTAHWNKFLQNNLTIDELNLFMDTNMLEINKFKQEQLDMFHQNPNEKLRNFLNSNSFSIDDILSFCIFLKDRRSCSNLFSPIITSTGLCYSLNMLDSSELFQNITYLPKNHVKHPKIKNWNIDSNYNKTLKSTIPIRIISENDGLYIQLKICDSHVEKKCENHKGFKITIHHPADLPTFSNRYSLLSSTQNYKIWIIPDIITTSTNLQNYSPQKRGCYFSQERKLKFFKIYTEPNCKLECISNFTTKLCMCNPYFIPHENSSKICGLSDISCLIRAKDEFLNLEMKMEIFENDTKYLSSETCDCLPSCTSIQYNSEVIPARLPNSIQNGTSYITVFMSYKDSNFITMERNELFSNADFWASCGGLLGLFTGFSVISLAEIIYFSTVKWVCRLCKGRCV